MSSGKRYQFRGTTIQVSNGVAPVGKTITDIEVQTDGIPIVTSAAHGLVLGDAGLITGVVGMTELNSGVYVIDNPSTNDFDLAGVDASGYNAYVSGGSFAPLVYSVMCELTGIDQQDGTADEIDVTTVCSTAKEFEIGLSDSGTLTLNYNYAPNTDIQTAFRAAKVSGNPIAVRVTLPNGGGTIVMLGSVQQSSFTGAVGQVWTGNTQLKLTGEIFVF